MPEVTQVHSSFGGRDIQAIMGKARAGILSGDLNFANDHEELEKLGIGWVKDAFDAQSEIAFGMDSIQGLATVASVVTPVQFLQNWLSGMVYQLFAARKIDELIGITSTGAWEDEEIVQPWLEQTGSPMPYGDSTVAPFMGYNINYVTRTVVRFEAAVRVGLLEEARAARVRANSGQIKRDSAALQLEIQRNMLGFYGYNAGNNFTYGFLNDPNLPAYVEVATGVGGFHWSQKTFAEIQLDLLTSLQQLRTNSQDTIDPGKTPITLACATNARDYLSTTTQFGISVMDWLKSTYPNVRVESAPQLNAANAGDGVFYMYAETVDDGSTDDRKTFIQAVPAKFQTLGVQKLMKVYMEDYGNASAGVLCKRPYAVTRYYNIS